ncbi:MAG: hypothetical protein KDC45_03285 [Bacteroidetes bacterium]|nr:hypothetical protein [Bacteroidota bacterium]
MNWLLSAALIILLSALIACERSSERHTEPSGEPLYLDEPLFQRYWTQLLPSDTVGGDFEFDLSGVSGLDSANDLQLSYVTGSGCDEDVLIFNTVTTSWDQIGYAPLPYVACAAVFSNHSHSLAANGLKSADHIDGDKKVLVRGSVGDLRIYPCRVNPGFRVIPLSKLRATRFDGLACDDSSFWLSSSLADSVYHVSSSGELLEKYAAPSENPRGMTYDGEFLWLIGGSRIFRMTRNWSIECEFSAPSDYPHSVAWLDDQLWLSETSSSSVPKTFCIDPEVSCFTDSAKVKSSFTTPGGGVVGLTSNGSQLIVASDSIFQVSSKGTILVSQTLPDQYSNYITPDFLGAIAWNSGSLWILHYWPGWLDDPVITSLRPRP